MKQLLVFVSIILILITMFGCIKRNSSGVVPKGIDLIINATESNPLGIDTIYVAPGDTTFIRVGFALEEADYVPKIEWSVGNTNVLKIEDAASYEGIAMVARVIAIGDSGDVTTVTARDVENNSEKSITVNVWKWVRTPSMFRYLGTFANNLYFMAKYQATWSAAETFCLEEGGHLLTIRDQAENDFVDNARAALDSVVWMNAFVPSPAGDASATFKPTTWGTGEPFDFTNWASGFPKSINAWEQFEALAMNRSGKWENRVNVANFYVLEIEWKE